MKSINVLVLGVGGPAGVNFARSVNLAKEDIVLYGTDINKYNIEIANPYYHYTSLVSEDEKLKIKQIKDIIIEYSIDFIYAQPDSEVLFLSKNRKEFEAITFLPKHKIILTCQDKFATSRIWCRFWSQTYGIMIYNKYDMKSRLHYIAKNLGDVFWLRSPHGAGGKASLLTKNETHAYYWCKFWSEHANISLMAQKYLSGRNFAWQSIWKDGELIVSQGRERLQYLYGNAAVSGISGSSSVSRLVNIDKLNVSAITASKLTDDKPHGIYSVDLTEDGYDIVPTEINAGRFFTMSYLLAKASVEVNSPRGNMPLMYLKLGNNLEIPYGSTMNILPPDYYWFRHVDCPAILKKVIY